MITEIKSPTISDLQNAMVYINRWAKLPNRWERPDRDFLYNLKAEKLVEWLNNGSVKITGVITREPGLFATIREYIGDRFSSFDEPLCHSSFDDIYDRDGYKNPVGALYHIEAWGYVEAPLSDEQKLAAKAENARLLEEYLNHNPNDALFFSVKPFHDYLIEKLENHKTEIDWLKSRNITKRQVLRIYKLIGDDVPADIQQAFAVVSKNKTKHVRPAKISETKIDIDVDVDTYEEGSIAIVDEALAYAREKMQKPDMTLSEAVEHYRDLMIFEEQQMLTDVCLKILDGKYESAEQVYDALFNHNLNLSDLGINTYTDRYGDTTHARFSNFHAYNFAPKGNWLVEFVSTIDNTITFHMPYSVAIENNLDLSGYPETESDVANYGRAITPAEQEVYPIAVLLAMFDLEPCDAPFELAQYVPEERMPRYRQPRYFNHFDDDDDDFDFDFDDDDD